MLYNVELVSVVQQCESAISVYIFPLFWMYLLPHPPPWLVSTFGSEDKEAKEKKKKEIPSFLELPSYEERWIWKVKIFITFLVVHFTENSQWGRGRWNASLRTLLSKDLKAEGGDSIDIWGIRVLGLGNTQCKGGMPVCSRKTEEVKVGWA